MYLTDIYIGNRILYPNEWIEYSVHFVVYVFIEP